jgi:N-acetylmuramoyl-L-alanine amidase
MFYPHRYVLCRPQIRFGHRLGLFMLLATGLGWGGHAVAQQPVPSADPSVAPANPTISGGRIVRPTLRLGSQGESVRELQSMLVLLGYYAGPVSGVFQEDTQLAVQRFQQATAITADGIVGPATWSKLLPAPAAETTPPGQTVATTAPATNPPTANPAPTNPPATNPPATNPPATNSRPTTPPTTTTPPASTTASLPVLRPGMEGEAVRFLQQRLTAKRVYNGPISGVFGPQTETAVRQLQRTNNLTVDGIVGPATWSVLN